MFFMVSPVGPALTLPHVFRLFFPVNEGWTRSVNTSSFVLLFSNFHGQERVQHLARPTSNLHPTINITITWSSGNVLSKISIWHIHTFGLKQDFYGWMPFLSPTLINSTVELSVFSWDTISPMPKSLISRYQTNPKTKILILQREYTVPYSVPERTFCLEQVRHEQAVPQELSEKLWVVEHNLVKKNLEALYKLFHVDKRL